MSKCDIRITFDKPDRKYTGGDVVSGEVHVTVNQDIRCNGIVLSHYWRTHGRGNIDQGEHREVRLCGIQPLQAGEELHLPFEFTAERWPLTYHGHYINVDHYVHVAVDVPWAIDPKQVEEYILIAGERPPEISGARGEVVEFSKPTNEASGIGKWILYGILSVFAIIFGILFFFLIPVFLVIGGLVWGWNILIASRVGEVELRTPHLVVGPNEMWPLTLSFTPKKSFAVNGITVRIFARESATSGSGTDKTTSHHTLHDEVATLHPAGMLMAGENFSEQFEFELPDTQAWSLDESDNDIKWWAELRIDIPRFPDWNKRVDLQMIPLEFLNEAVMPDAEPRAAHGEKRRSQDSGSRIAAAPEPPPLTDFWEEDSDGPGSDALLTLVAEIRKAGRFGNERSEMVNSAAGDAFDVSVVISRTSPTFGFVGDDQRFEHGKTVIGTLRDSDQEVQLFTVGATNDDVENVARGEAYETLATVKGWDSLYDRLVLHEVPID